MPSSRRGVRQPRRGRKIPNPPEAKPIRLNWELYKRIVADSPLKSQSVKESLAETLITLIAAQQDLQQKLELGNIVADEFRAIPSVASNIKRICDSLQVTMPVEEEVEDFNG